MPPIVLRWCLPVKATSVPRHPSMRDDAAEGWWRCAAPAGLAPRISPTTRSSATPTWTATPRVYFASGSWAVVDGIRCHNTWDGFGVYGDGTRTATGTIYIRNSWFWKNRDDGIENDEQRQLHLFNYEARTPCCPLGPTTRPAPRWTPTPRPSRTAS